MLGSGEEGYTRCVHNGRGPGGCRVDSSLNVREAETCDWGPSAFEPASTGLGREGLGRLTAGHSRVEVEWPVQAFAPLSTATRPGLVGLGTGAGARAHGGRRQAPFDAALQGIHTTGLSLMPACVLAMQKKVHIWEDPGWKQWGLPALGPALPPSLRFCSTP